MPDYGKIDHKSKMIFTIECNESDQIHDWDRNKEMYDQWRKQLDNYSMEFIENVILAGADILQYRKSLKREKE